MLEFIRNGKVILKENDDGQFEFISEDAQLEYDRAKARMEEDMKEMQDKIKNRQEKE